MGTGLYRGFAESKPGSCAGYERPACLFAFKLGPPITRASYELSSSRGAQHVKQPGACHALCCLPWQRKGKHSTVAACPRETRSKHASQCQPAHPPAFPLSQPTHLPSCRAYTDWRNQLQKRKSLNAWGNNSGQGPAAGDANANTAAGAGTSQPGLEASTQMAATTAQAPAQAPGAGPAAEQQPQQRSQQQQPQHQASGQLQEVGSPEDDLKQPRFLSLDNPIVLTFTVLGMLAFAASLQGR